VPGSGIQPIQMDIKMKSSRLKLLEYVSNQYKDIDLSKSILIACQHLLGTTVDLLDEMFGKGLSPQNTYVVGKCYSTNNKVFQDIKSKNVNISVLSKSYNSHKSYDKQFKLIIDKFINNVISSTDLTSFEKIIILDDGGELLLQFSELPISFNHCIGIEQTSSGYNKINHTKLKFPIINVARSEAKLKIESPLIADLVVNKIKSYLSKMRVTDPRILIVGNGYIGKGIYNKLKSDYNATVYDKLSHGEIFPGKFNEQLDQFDIIIGATGNQIISSRDFKKLKENVILISASSSDREFASFCIRKYLRKNSNCHKDISYKGVRLLNSGFPINFDGKFHSLAPEKIQLTRSLLLTAIFQGLSNKYPKKIIELDQRIQNELARKFRSLEK
jgi:S-adenosylhomocysteine hydrolase